MRRDDRAVERLAEVQDEIRWPCEAARVPAIQASQAPEALTQTGGSSRAEITDAAMAYPAECVMLNEDPHIVEAVVMLDGILRRMPGHQAKKRTMLREPTVAHAIERMTPAARRAKTPILVASAQDSALP